MTIYLIVDLSCCPLAVSSGAVDFQHLHARLQVLVACMLACRLRVRLHVRLHVGLQALHVGCSPVAFVLSAYMLACMSACMLVVVMLSACIRQFMRRAYLHTVSQAHAYVNAHAHALHYVTMHT